MELNIARINEVITWLENPAPELAFNMASFVADCGTTCCIAGYLAETTPKADRVQYEGQYDSFNYTQLASDQLGLSYTETEALCMPQDLNIAYEHITARMAIATLKNLKWMGEVVWHG